jgi:hypothetical protein
VRKFVRAFVKSSVLDLCLSYFRRFASNLTKHSSSLRRRLFNFAIDSNSSICSRIVASLTVELVSSSLMSLLNSSDDGEKRSNDVCNRGIRRASRTRGNHLLPSISRACWCSTVRCRLPSSLRCRCSCPCTDSLRSLDLRLPTTLSGRFRGGSCFRVYALEPCESCLPSIQFGARYVCNSRPSRHR